jgi:single-strand DNA-binding protein
MNEVRISGRLTNEPAVKQLGDASTMAVASLAINDSYITPTGKQGQATTFVDVTVWGQEAERLAKLQKGQEAQVVGSLRQRQWQDNSGQKRTKLYVKAWEWAAIERERAELAKPAPEMER